jgi:hypothetical protein
LDPAEELVEVDVEVRQQDGQGRQRRQGATVLDRAHEGSGVRRGDSGLAQAGIEPSSTQLPADRGRQRPGRE